MLREFGLREQAATILHSDQVHLRTSIRMKQVPAPMLASG